MKKFFAIAAAAAALVACNEKIEIQTPANTEMGTLSICVAPESALLTKAAPEAYTAAQTYEAQANKLQILVFDASDGKLIHYEKFTSNITTTKDINVQAGSYNVYAIVNGPDITTAQQATETAYKAVTIDLPTNSKTAATGFVMTGSAANIAVTAQSGGTAAITVKRHTSRVALHKVTNACPAAYGDITIQNVWLANVVANQTVVGEDAPATWYNKFSRKNETPLNVANIITSSSADEAALTFKAIGQNVATGAAYTPATPDLVYGYANSTTSLVTFDKANFQSTFAPTKTRLVVEAKVNGTVYYYPYDLAFTARNKAHTIDMIISGPGLDDPQGNPEDLKKNTLSVTVTIADWEAGESQEVSY